MQNCLQAGCPFCQANSSLKALQGVNGGDGGDVYGGGGDRGGDGDDGCGYGGYGGGGGDHSGDDDDCGVGGGDSDDGDDDGCRKCRPLWSFEEITSKVQHIKSADSMALLLSYLVRIFTECLPSAHIVQRWARDAIHLALSCSSRHYAGRSFQVSLALSLSLSLSVCLSVSVSLSLSLFVDSLLKVF